MRPRLLSAAKRSSTTASGLRRVVSSHQPHPKPLSSSSSSSLSFPTRAMATKHDNPPSSSPSEPLFPPSAAKWWTLDTIAVVTGANQGIGKEVARQLAAQGLTVVATARDPQRGQAAVDELQADAEVVAAGGRVVLFSPLDLADSSTVEALAAALRSGKLVGGGNGNTTNNAPPVAILVNNAGLAYKGDAWGADEARRTIDINFRGTRAAVRALLPLMREGCGRPSAAPLLPRVVNVTSSAGGLGMFDRATANPSASADLKRQFLAAGQESDEHKGDALLDGLAAAFEASVADGTWKQKGWPGTMYGVSKALENAYGRQLAGRGAAQGGGFVSLNVHPGYISTAMSSFRGPLPPSRGADTIVWAALLPPEEVRRANGLFYHDRQPREY